MRLRHLLFSAFMVLLAGTAWADVEINAINFPDGNFRGWLIKQNYGADGVLTDAEISEVKVMAVYSENIQSLQGIEYFTALTDLDCCSNHLTSLDLSKNTALSYLACEKNQLISLDLSKNTALKELWCKENSLASLDVTGCTALTTLNCSSNHLTSLDVSKCSELTRLWCPSNQMTSLDVTGCTALTKLFCYDNQLASLDVTGCTMLTNLWCNDNLLTSLDVTGCAMLTEFSCFSNQIKDAAMDALIKSMPTINNGIMFVVGSENDQNVMTTSQVAAAKAKGWTPCYFDGTEWKEYSGIDPTAAIIAIGAGLTSDTAPWYALDGTQFSEKPAAAGIYVHAGRKVVVK